MDPIEIRMKNYAATDQRTNRPFSAKHLDRCYRKGAEMIGWRTPSQNDRTNGNKRRGIGMAGQTWGGGGTARLCLGQDQF